MLLFRALFLFAPVEFVCDAHVCCSWVSIISQSKDDRFVDRMKCLFFLGAPLMVIFFGGARIEVVSGKANFQNCSLMCNFML